MKNSQAFGDVRRQRVLKKCAGYISKEGVMHLASDTHRSQKMNKEEVISRLHMLVNEAIQVPKYRKKSRPTMGSKKRHLEGKKRRGDLKKNRGNKDWD